MGKSRFTQTPSFVTTSNLLSPPAGGVILASVSLTASGIDVSKTQDLRQASGLQLPIVGKYGDSSLPNRGEPPDRCGTRWRSTGLPGPGSQRSDRHHERQSDRYQRGRLPERNRAAQRQRRLDCAGRADRQYPQHTQCKWRPIRRGDTHRQRPPTGQRWPHRADWADRQHPESPHRQ